MVVVQVMSVTCKKKKNHFFFFLQTESKMVQIQKKRSAVNACVVRAHDTFVVSPVTMLFSD